MKRKKIVYKVVVNRRSCCLSAWSPYSLSYPKNIVVKGIPNTLGIFTFKRLKDAKNFLPTLASSPSELPKIIKIEPIGKGTIPLSMSGEGRLEGFYDKSKCIPPHYIVSPPKGTVCYPAVRVME